MKGYLVFYYKEKYTNQYNVFFVFRF